MKIQKGHYVPKELITSEAVHEAVVKCFVAAGFHRNSDYVDYRSKEHWECIAISGSGVICWSQEQEKPLTLQQLFTAENGLQWPTSAYRVLASSTCVWFDLSQLPPVVISGNYSGFDECRVLAIRQPNALTQAKSLTHSEEGLTHSEWYKSGGNPPIGTMVDIVGDGLIYGQGETGEVVGYFIPPNGKNLCGVNIVNMSYGMGCFYSENLRPAKTEREKFIDAALAVFDSEKPFAADGFAAALYRAGFRGPKVDK